MREQSVQRATAAVAAERHDVDGDPAAQQLVDQRRVRVTADDEARPRPS
jgi:hypothetical protein